MINEASNSGNPRAGQGAGQSGQRMLIPNVHVDEALARFAGDMDRYRHWLREFVDHGPAAVAQIRQAIANGSQETAIKLAHALKGRTGMLGMTELHSLSQTLELTLRNGEPTAFWLDELERAADDMARELTTALKARRGE